MPSPDPWFADQWYAIKVFYSGIVYLVPCCHDGTVTGYGVMHSEPCSCVAEAKMKINLYGGKLYGFMGAGAKNYQQQPNQTDK